MRFLFTLILILSASSANAGSKIFCEFKQEAHPDGKSNEASCAMSPENTQSTKHYTPNRNDHCDTSHPLLIQDYNNFIVDIERNSVSYDHRSYIPNFAKEMLDGNLDKSNYIEHNIDNIFYTSTKILRKNGKFLKRPYPKATIYNIVYDGNILQVIEGIPEAILSRIETIGDDNSWLDIRFGICRIE